VALSVCSGPGVTGQIPVNVATFLWLTVCFNRQTDVVTGLPELDVARQRCQGCCSAAAGMNPNGGSRSSPISGSPVLSPGVVDELGRSMFSDRAPFEEFALSCLSRDENRNSGAEFGDAHRTEQQRSAEHGP